MHMNSKIIFLYRYNVTKLKPVRKHTSLIYAYVLYLYLMPN